MTETTDSAATGAGEINYDGYATDREAELAHALAASRAREAELRRVLDYLFDTNNGCDGRARIMDACFTAFMRAKDANKDDGGPTDWFTDTKPAIDNLVARMKERVLAALSPNAKEADHD